MRRASFRFPSGGSALVAVGLLLTGCSTVSGPPSPEPVAEQLAVALANGDFADIEFADADPAEVSAQYLEVTSGVSGASVDEPDERDVEPIVELVDVTEEGPMATATYRWSWPVGQEAWGYESQARLDLNDEDQWEVNWGTDVIEPSLEGETILDLVPIAGRRGEILGQRNRKIVTPRDVVRVGIDRTQVGKARSADSARALARLADVAPDPFAKTVRAAGEKAFVEAITFRASEVPQDLVDGSESIKGARLIGATEPLAPRRGFAAPILGTVGEVTAEMLEDEPERYSPGQTAGLSGLQARYDQQLQPTDGVLIEAVAGDRTRELVRVQPQKGEPLRTTLDIEAQLAAEDALSQVKPAASLVAIRPSDGHVLAIADGPGSGGVNLATFGQFAPGSTFKTVTSLALLRAGLTADGTVPCTSAITVNGKQFTNYTGFPSSGLGQVPLRRAVADSCNTAFISQVGRLEAGSLADAAASLGMGVDADVGFPAFFGTVEPAGGETEAAANTIGQGRILASPLTMATVMASVVNGKRVVPTLIPAVEVPDAGQKPLTEGEASTLRDLLRGVVTDGSGRVLADVPGPPILAKTGTAEFSDDGTVRTHAWMIAGQGDLAVAAFVRTGDSGSGTAGPILEQFLRQVG